MCAPFGGRDIVDVAVETLGKFLGILQRNVPRHPFGLPLDCDHVVVNLVAGLVEILDKLLDAPLVAEGLGIAAGRVGKGNLDARIEEGELPQPAGEDIPGELGLGENLRIGLERGLCAHPRGRSHPADRTGRLPPLILLLPDMPLAADLHLAPL